LFKSRFSFLDCASVLGETTGIEAETTGYGGKPSDKARCGFIEMSQGKMKPFLPQFLSFADLSFQEYCPTRGKSRPFKDTTGSAAEEKTA
jgi:hypothetical protein